jgi:hypothetical protein
MYLVREVFKTKPGKAKELVRKFKDSSKYFEKDSMKDFKVMTDIATTYWTVVMQFEVEDLGKFAKELRGGGKPNPELENIMKGYLDLVDNGYREIFLIE